MSDERDRWQGHPGQAKALRIAVVVAPLIASLAVVGGVSRLLDPVHSGWALAVRMLFLVAVAMIVAAVTERLARRLLPLSILLELSMLFPDRAPSRLAVARRARDASRSPRDLLKRNDEDAASAAVRILALMSALAAHDRRTRGHAERVRAFTDLLAVQMELPRADRDKLRWAALLHDVGKLGVRASLLNKPTALDASEWETIRRHPAEGQRLAGPLLPWLGEWGAAIVEHHERFDGSGYPMGLAGTGISRAGRMVGVVDAYETMTAARAYKKAFATRDARAELARNAGSQFDPAIVRAFLAVSLPRMLWASGPLSFLVQLPFLRIIQEAGLRLASVSGSVAATTTAVAGAAVISLPVVGLAAAATTQRPEHRVGTTRAAAPSTTAADVSRGSKPSVSAKPARPSVDTAKTPRVAGAAAARPRSSQAPAGPSPVATAVSTLPVAGRPAAPVDVPASSSAVGPTPTSAPAPAPAASRAPEPGPTQTPSPTRSPETAPAEPTRTVSPAPRPTTIASTPAPSKVAPTPPPAPTATAAPQPSLSTPVVRTTPPAVPTTQPTVPAVQPTASAVAPAPSAPALPTVAASAAVPGGGNIASPGVTGQGSSGSGSGSSGSGSGSSGSGSGSSGSGSSGSGSGKP